MGQNLYHGMLMPLHDSMPSFMYFRRVLDLLEFKNKASQCFAGNQWCPGVWNSFPFLAWDLRMQTRTHIWFLNKFICTRACACSSNLNYAHKCIENLFLFCIFLPRHASTMTWHHAKFHDFKTKFLNVLDQATMPRCLNFILIFCMGPTPSFHLYRAYCVFQDSLWLLTRLIAHEMYTMQIILLEAPLTYKFEGMLCVSCMSYIIALTFGQS